MKIVHSLLLLPVILSLSACKSKIKKQETATFLTAKEAVLLNQLVYKKSPQDSIANYAPGFGLVFLPASIDGNLAFIAKKKDSLQYALVVRGSMIEFSNDGFHNFILQDFNIFNLKKWEYADTVKEAYLGRGTYIGFQNLLQLKDAATGLSIKEFIEQKLPAGSSLIVTGHSLGGNLAYPLAGYLKKELKGPVKDNLQLITFGATAAGNAAFVQDLEDKFPDGERYVIDKDIAPAFPDHQRMGEIARNTGLDKVLDFKKIGLDAGDVLDIVGVLLEQTNVVNESNKYFQSQKHLRLLKSAEPPPAAEGTEFSADALFGRAYLFHRVDLYAELMGWKMIQ